MKKILSLKLLFTFLVSNLGFSNGLLAQSIQDNLDSSLFAAIKANNLEQIKQLVKKGADINVQDENKATPLMWASYKGDVELVKFMIKKKADYTKKGVIYTNKEKTGYYGNLLCIAAGENKLELLNYLLEKCKITIEDKEYDPETQKETGWTALQWAASKGNNEIIEFLLNKGANINANHTETKSTPLIYAIENKKYETVKLLINKGADVNIAKTSGWGALHYLARDNKKELLILAIKKGAKLNVQNTNSWTPLMLAGYNGNMSIFQTLLDKGADINIKNNKDEKIWELKDKDKWTVLHYAARDGYEDITRILLEKGANPNAQATGEDVKGWAPIHLAAHNNNLGILKILYWYGADIRLKNGNNEKAIDIAQKKNHKKIIEFLENPYKDIFEYVDFDLLQLVKKKIKEKPGLINLQNKENGETLLFEAIRENSTELFDYLVDRNCNLDIKNNYGFDVLIYSTALNRINFVKKLLHKGVDIDSKNNNGWSPIHFSVRFNYFEMTKLLLKSGADVNALGKEMLSPLMIASLYGNHKMVKLLIHNKASLKQKNTLNKTAYEMSGEINNLMSFSPTQLVTWGRIMLCLNDDFFRGELENKTWIQERDKVANFLKNPSINIFDLYELGYREGLKERISPKKNILDARSSDGQTLLHKAVLMNDIGFASFLIRNKVNLEIKDNNGRTPLMLSMICNNFDIARLLIENNANILAKDGLGYCPVEYCKIMEIDSVINIDKNFTLSYRSPMTIDKNALGSIEDFKISPDFRFILSYAGNVLILRDANTGYVLKKHDLKHEIVSIDFSPSGLLYAASLKNDQIVLFNLLTNEVVKTIYADHLQGYQVSEAKSLMCFLSDSVLISTNVNNEILKINRFTGTVKKLFYGKRPSAKKKITGIDISPDKNYLLTSDGGTVRQWDLKLNEYVKGYYYTESLTVIFSKTAKYFAVIDSGAQLLTIYNTKQQKSIKKIRANYLTSVDFSMDDRYMFYVSNANIHRLRLLSGNVKTLLGENFGFGVVNIAVTPKCIYASLLNVGEIIAYYGSENRHKTLEDNYIANRYNDVVLSFNNKNIILNEHVFDLAVEINLLNLKKMSGVDSTFSAIEPTLSNNKKRLVYINYIDSSYKYCLYNFENNKEEVSFFDKERKSCPSGLDVTNDGHHFLTYSYNNFTLWNAKKRKKLFENRGDPNIQMVKFIPNKKLIVSLHNYQYKKKKDFESNIAEWDNHLKKERIKIWDLNNKKQYGFAITGWLSDDIRDVECSKDGSYLAVLSSNLYLLNLNTSEKVPLFADFSGELEPLKAEFTFNNKYLIVGYSDRVLRVWDVKTRKVIATFSGHKERIFVVSASTDSVHFISASLDGEIKFWDIKTKELVLSLIPYAYHSWLAKTPEGYYFIKKGKFNDLIGFKVDLDVYGFEQFELKYNRPDKVFEALPYSDKRMIPVYKKAYEKRLQKLGFNEKMFNKDWHIPEVELLNKEKIAYNSTEAKLKLKTLVKDNKYKLDRINVWVNNISIYGRNGIDLRKMDISKTEMDIEVILSEGENKIEVSVLNQKGAESYKEMIDVYYKPKIETKPNLYILGIGSSDFKNISNLPNTDTDIREFINFYKTKESSLFEKVFFDTLINENVLKKNILNKKQWLQNTTVNDIVIVYYSGHGSLYKNNDYYLYSYNVDTANIAQQGILYDDLENLLDGIPARRKLLLVNACHSGEYDKDMEIFKLMKETFPELRRGTGATIIASSYANEYSLTSSTTGRFGNNSAFGFAIEQLFLENKSLTVNELKTKLEKKVSKLSRNRQKPTFRNENLEMDFRIW
jgi:ankyrin repeat protein